MSRLPGLPYVVVDSNQLRFPEVIEPLLQEYDRAGQRIVLPAVSSYELTKGGGNNFVASVRLLQRRPEAISVAHHSLTMVRQHEQKFAHPVVDVIDADNTKRLRTILRQLRDGDLTEEEVRTGLAEMATGARAQVAGLGYDSLIRSGVKMAAVLSNEQRNAFGSAFRGEDRAALANAIVPNLTEAQLLDLLFTVVKVPYAKARKLVRVPSFAVLLLIAPILLSLRWAALGGIENTRQPLENDGIDMEHALIALYGRDFVSKDRRALAQYETLRAIVDARWP